MNTLTQPLVTEHSIDCPEAFGIRGTIKTVHGLPGRFAYNAAIIADGWSGGGEYTMLYRTDSPGSSISRVALNKDFEPIISSIEPLPLVSNIDPRLTYFANYPMLLTTYCSGAGDRPELRQFRSFTMMDRSMSPEPDTRIDHVQDWPGFKKRHLEKNWTPFEHVDDTGFHRLLLIYTIGPVHRLLRLDYQKNTVHLHATAEWELPHWWQHEWGRELRGSAPPLLMNEHEYLSTWHTRVNNDYYTGFYTFSVVAPFAPIAITPPVLLPEHVTGGRYGRDWNKGGRVIFINGMVIENDRIILSGGDSDDKVILALFDRHHVGEILRPIDESPLPTIRSMPVASTDSTPGIPGNRSPDVKHPGATIAPQDLADRWG